MLITDIEISDYSFCPESSGHSASVCMTLADQIVTLFCRVTLPEQSEPQQRAQALVQDALRQMRRMPEYRSGQKTLLLDEGLALEVA